MCDFLHFIRINGAAKAPGDFTLSKRLILAALIVASPGLGSEQTELIVQVSDGYSVQDINDAWGTRTLERVGDTAFHVLLAPDGVPTDSLAQEMLGAPAVDQAEPNWDVETSEAVRQMVVAVVGGRWEEFADQGMTERIGLPAARKLARGRGVRVAVLDTGVDPEHPALACRLSEDGWDMVDRDDTPWETANHRDDDDDDQVDEAYGHGTMVAGLVGLVAPDAEIVPIRVLNDDGLGRASDIVHGLLHAIELGVDVINMSFGSPYQIHSIADMLAVAWNQGIVMVAGAGNENRAQDPYFPAADPHCFMVTSVDSMDVKADFADYGPEVLVSAPGVGLRSTYPRGRWGIGSGNSFATALVSGEVAIVQGLIHEEPGDLEHRVLEAVEPIDELAGNHPYREQLGSGRIYLPWSLDGIVPPNDKPFLGPRIGCIAFKPH